MLISAFPVDEEGFLCFLEETEDTSHCRLIDNKISSRSRIKGYCASSLHPGYLTDKHIKQHQCNEKACKYLYIPAKKVKNAAISSQFEIEDIRAKVIEKANKAIKAYEGIKIIKAEYDEINIWNLYYASIASYDIEKISKILKKKLNTNIKLHKMNLDFETSARLVFGE